jgi:hypothetical protein
MEDVTLSAPDTTEVERMIPTVQGMASGIVVANEDDAADAAEFVRQINAKKKEVEDVFNPSIAAAYTAHKLLCEQRAKYTKPLDEAAGVVRGKINRWADEVQRLRDEEARLLREQARKEREEAALREAEARQKAGVADLDLAEAARDADFQAELAHEEAVEAAPRPAAAGVAMRTTWSAHVTDKVALIAFVAAHPGTEHYLEPNQKLLDSMAKQQKDKLAIPGVRVASKSSAAIR